MLYIFWFLHQTTTRRGEGAQKGCCISFDSYIKPQHPILCLETSSVVYLLIPTSNHNSTLLVASLNVLYIFWFLHQTTTVPMIGLPLYRCISFDFYIKPQLKWNNYLTKNGCISFDSYIKPQPVSLPQSSQYVVYLLIPTSNHNSWHRLVWRQHVVYLLNPTSNHNCANLSKDSYDVVYLLNPTSNHNYYG